MFGKRSEFEIPDNPLFIYYYNVFTYISDDGSKMSYVDHILCRTSFDEVLNDVVILNDVIGSDHKPVLFNFESDLHLPTIVEAECGCSRLCTPVWHSCDSATLVYYESHLDNLLRTVC